MAPRSRSRKNNLRASPDPKDPGFDPCPDDPCIFCTGNSASRWPKDQHGGRVMTSWEWCQSANACAATIDWELIYHGR